MPVVKMPDGTLVDMPENPTAEQLQSLRGILSQQPSQAEKALDETGRVIARSAYGGATAIPRLVLMGGDWLESKFPTPEWSKIPDLGIRKVDAAIMKATEPQTGVGKAAANVGEAAVAALFGPAGGLSEKARLAIGASSGLGSEASAKLFGDNALSRIAGGVVGGGVASLVHSMTNADKLIHRSVSQVPDQDWRRAEAIKKTLDANDVPHLNSQLLGDSSTLSDLTAVMATHPTTRPKLLSAVKNAPDKARKAFEVWKNSNLPIGVDETKQVLGDVQGAAEARLRALKGQANDAYAAALPPGASQGLLPAASLEGGIDGLRQVAANTDMFGRLSAGGDFLESLAKKLEAVDASGIPIASGEVNNLLKTLNTVAEQAGYKGTGLNAAKQILREMTPEFEAARAAKSAVMTDVVSPAQKGLTGQLAQMGGGIRPDKFTAKETALKMVFPTNIAQPQAIRELGDQLGGDAVGALLREHLSRSMEDAVKLAKPGASAQQPFNFVAAIAGKNAQRQNLEAALEITAKANGANPFAVRNGFYKLMRGFESFKNLKLPESVDRAVLQQQAGANLPGVLVAPQSRLGRYLWERMTEKTFKRISDTILSPDGLKQLEKLGKTPGPRTTGALVRSIISVAVDDDQQE